MKHALLVWCAFLILALTFVWKQSSNWIEAAEQVDHGFRRSGELTSNVRPGGIFLENDSYYWLSYANRIGTGEDFRIRDTDADNVPYGREVHWSQSISWMLVALGNIRSLVTGDSWAQSLESAAVFLNPLLLSLFACAMGFILLRSVGAIPAGMFLLYFVTQPDVTWAFNPLRPDHQTLHCIFGVLTLVGVILGGAGWINATNVRATPRPLALIRPIRVPSEREAQVWFLLSAVATGLGLWISATVETMLLLALYGAMVFLAVFAPALKPDSGVHIRPDVWRFWGWSAGMVSLFFYLLEYFPSHLHLRLEVNSPLYAVMVIAMGESACAFLRARYSTQWHRPALRALLCGALAALLPLAILFGPPDWHAMRDAEMLRLHNFIQEFYAFPRLAGDEYISHYIAYYGLLPLFLVAALLVANSKRLPLNEWAIVWVSFALTYTTLGLAYVQVRWLSVYAAMNIWLAVLVSVCAWFWFQRAATQKHSFLLGTGLVCMLLVQPIFFAIRGFEVTESMIRQKSALPEMVTPVINKHLALQLKEIAGPGARIMGDPSIAPALYYFAGASSVASFYWENTAGLHSATAFLCDEGDSAAERISRERQISIVILPKGEGLASYASFISIGRFDPEAVSRTFASRLPKSELNTPEWLKSDPAMSSLGSESYRIFGKPIQQQIRIFRTRLSTEPENDTPPYR